MKSKFLIGITLIAMLALTACGGGSNGGPTGEPQESSSSSSQASAPAEGSVALDPAQATDAKALEAVGHVYESLVAQRDGAPIPGLSVEVTASADQLDYIFALRPGVTFHDGTPFNADAVLTNFNRWFDPQDPLHGSGDYSAWVSVMGGFKGETTADGQPKSNFDGIEKVNELTVIIHLNNPDLDFVSKLTNPAFSIVSPAALQNGADGGTGPYIIAGWDAPKLTLAPYSGYWNQSAIPTGNLELELSE